VNVPTTIDTLKMNNTLSPYVSVLKIDADTRIRTFDESGERHQVFVSISPGATLTLEDLNTSKVGLTGSGNLVVDGTVIFQSVGYDNLAQGFTGNVLVQSGTFRSDGIVHHFRNAASVTVLGGATYANTSQHFGSQYLMGLQVNLAGGATLSMTGVSPWNPVVMPLNSPVALTGGQAVMEFSADGRKAGPGDVLYPETFYLDVVLPVVGAGGLQLKSWASVAGGLTPVIRLSADNTYAGSTTVTQGILELSGSLANGNITIAPGALMRGGSGTIYFHLGVDQILNEGTLDLTNLTLVLLGPGTDPTYDIVVGGGQLLGDMFADVQVPQDWGDRWDIWREGSVITVKTPAGFAGEIPEPATLLSLGLGAAALLRRRRA